MVAAALFEGEPQQLSAASSRGGRSAAAANGPGLWAGPRPPARCAHPRAPLEKLSAVPTSASLLRPSTIARLSLQ